MFKLSDMVYGRPCIKNKLNFVFWFSFPEEFIEISCKANKAHLASSEQIC